jgi:hypothetical protein
MLDRELKFYQENLQNWLRDYPGKYVVVKNDKLIGFFDHYEQALSEGARRFGLTSFLARKIEPTQEEIFIPALTLGLLNGNSSFSGDGSEKGS